LKHVLQPRSEATSNAGRGTRCTLANSQTVDNVPPLPPTPFLPMWRQLQHANNKRISDNRIPDKTATLNAPGTCCEPQCLVRARGGARGAASLVALDLRRECNSIVRLRTQTRQRDNRRKTAPKIYVRLMIANDQSLLWLRRSVKPISGWNHTLDSFHELHVNCDGRQAGGQAGRKAGRQTRRPADERKKKRTSERNRGRLAEYLGETESEVRRCFRKMINERPNWSE
jgi:hypothetical protein